MQEAYIRMRLLPLRHGCHASQGKTAGVGPHARASHSPALMDTLAGGVSMCMCKCISYLVCMYVYMCVTTENKVFEIRAQTHTYTPTHIYTAIINGKKQKQNKRNKKRKI